MYAIQLKLIIIPHVLFYNFSSNIRISFGFIVENLRFSSKLRPNLRPISFLCRCWCFSHVLWVNSLLFQFLLNLLLQYSLFAYYSFMFTIVTTAQFHILLSFISSFPTDTREHHQYNGGKCLFRQHQHIRVAVVTLDVCFQNVACTF